jgi:hypothetical protein
MSDDEIGVIEKEISVVTVRFISQINRRNVRIIFCLFLVSYALPDLCDNATWHENATTFANQSIVGWNCRGLFIDRYDHIYAADHTNNRILVWQQGQRDPILSLQVKLYLYTTLFVDSSGDIYFENGDEQGRIDAWSISSNSTVSMTNFSDHCFGLFLDMNNSLYCCSRNGHRVEKVSLKSLNKTPITVAGIGSAGSGIDQLSYPYGIFVDAQFNLYVADAGNSRIQLVRQGQLNAITVAGNGVPGFLQLRYPTDVTVDLNGHIYIADNQHDRVILVNGNVSRCISGCTGKAGSAANELKIPYSLRLDSEGHLYVADEHNHRIQKFHLLNTGCGMYN